MIGCKGGFCKSRNNCAHYTESVRHVDDPDRLCGDVEEPERLSVTVRRAVGEWEAHGSPKGGQAHPFDWLLKQ